MPNSKSKKTVTKKRAAKGTIAKIYNKAKGVVGDVLMGAATGAVSGAAEAVNGDIAPKRVGSKTTAKKAAAERSSTTKSKPAAKKTPAKATAVKASTKKR